MKGFKHHVAKWKWVIIILLVIAMPMFFYYYRTVQLGQAIESTDSTVQSAPNNN
jgi:hypothetical protein